MDKITCANWDSFDPQPLYVGGKRYGTLMPRATQEQLGYGIQGWSKPVTETRIKRARPALYLVR